MKNRKFITLLMVILSSFTVNLDAQSDNQTKTLLGQNNGIKNIGFILSPSYAMTFMDGTSASILSIRGGIVLSKKITIGGFYNFSLNEIKPESELVPNIYMDYRVGGGFLEYTIYSDKLIHFTFPLFIGGGEVEMDNEIGNINLVEQHFFLLNPSALLEINLHKYVRLNIGADYRYISQMNYRTINQSDISGFSACVGLKFGIF